MKTCIECYSKDNRTTPLLNKEAWLLNHTQYICGTCGRCICIEKDPIRGLYRWNFPFSSVDDAILYLRVANYITQTSCGIYRSSNQKGRDSYKIFVSDNDFKEYVRKNNRVIDNPYAVFKVELLEMYNKTQIRKLSTSEVKEYLENNI